MLDIKFIRENVDLVKEALSQKLISLDVDELLGADHKVLELKKRLQALQEEKNANAKKTPKASPDERAALIERGREIGGEIKRIEPDLQAAEAKLQQLLWLVPQIPSEKAPRGKSSDDNVEVKQWGEKTQKSFPLKDHVQLLETQGWADFERTAKVCGSRTYSLKGEMVLLEMAILRLAVDHLTQKGYELMSLPALVREPALFGTGHFPTGRDQVYYLPADDLYLAGTAEVPINSLYSGEILSEAQLPLLFGGYSPCFRREAGSAGRDVRGLIRVHQFFKVEQFVICKKDPEESEKWHQHLLRTSEEIVQALELPYRVVECCTGDMGAGKYRMYDIECWVPSEKTYRETHSCSNLQDWQARRTNLRYRDANGDVQFCHTLNNTAVATPRILVPFLENHQRADGAIDVPRALRPYLGNRDRLERASATRD